MKNEKKEEMVITIERDDLFEIVNSLTWALSLLVASVILFVKRKIFLSLARGFFLYISKVILYLWEIIKIHRKSWKNWNSENSKKLLTNLCQYSIIINVTRRSYPLLTLSMWKKVRKIDLYIILLLKIILINK